MIKNWKNLFVKNEEEDRTSSPQPTTTFPVTNQHPGQSAQQSFPSTDGAPVNPDVREVLDVYEKGLASINMPGYDFYEYYMAVNAAGFNSEQAYNMAFKMAKAMDNTLSVQKLVSDAEFYISKINEVHSQYVGQGQQKLNELKEKKNAQKNDLSKSLDQANMRVAQLKAELQQLELEIKQKKESLAGIDAQFEPQEGSVRVKLEANDFARNTSTSKLTTVRDYIQKFVKNI